MSATCGPLAQSEERGTDNAKVVSSILTRTTKSFISYETWVQVIKACIFCWPNCCKPNPEHRLNHERKLPYLN